MDTRNGSAILILVQTAVGPPAVYTAVGHQMGAKFSRKAKEVDVSDKSNVDDQFIPGSRGATMTLDSIYAASDAALAALRTSHDTSSTLILERQEDGTVLEHCTAFVSGIDEDFPRAGASKFAATFTRTGSWTPGAAP